MKQLSLLPMYAEESEGFEYRIYMGPLGSLCGYIGIPYEHPLFGKEFDELMDIRVHGGWTYARNWWPYVGSGGPRTWVIGFDCAHFGDLTPATYVGVDDVWRTPEFVEEQLLEAIKHLARRK